MPAFSKTYDAAVAVAAGRLGCFQQTVQRIEAGKLCMRLDTFLSLAGALELPLSNPAELIENEVDHSYA